MNTVDPLYRGWDAGVVRERRNDDANFAQVPFSSSFTAINQQQTQLLTPESSAFGPVQQNQARRRATGTVKRQRNPTVAQYLGLGSEDEPVHLEKYAPLPDGPRSPPSRPLRKRQKLGGTENSADRMSTRPKKTHDSIQRRVSEGLRVTKPRAKIVVGPKALTPEASLPDGASEEAVHQQDAKLERSAQDDSRYPSHNIAVKRSLVATTGKAARGTSNEYHADTELSDFTTHDCDTDGPEQFDRPQVSTGESIFDDEDFEDDLNDDEFLELTADMIDTGGSIRAFSSSPLRPDVAHTQYSGSSTHVPIIIEEENSTQRRAKKFVSPITLTTRLLAATGDIDTVEARKPIARPLFPDAVRDRSPIIGLSSSTLLRTCFRIGEVINQAHQADKTGKHITFELYARILDSERDNKTQFFTFCDLFHGKPPYLKAAYDAALWKSVQLFNYDSKRLLQQGRIGRCMGTMKREGKEWIMTVLNIWEATWDDIKWVEGIVNA